MIAMPRAEINGIPATMADLHRLATVNYGHFTSMQVRDGRVAGLDLHLRRLEDTSRELFAEPVDGPTVRGWIRVALAGDADATVRVTVFGGGRNQRVDAAPAVLVSVADPMPDGPQPAWRLRTTTYVRDLPHIKHVATMGLIRHWRRAQADGFDDALFADEAGRISEGTAWNLALWDGEHVVWPDAPQLAGITMQLLKPRIPSVTRPLNVRDLAEFRGAVTTYSSWPGQPVASVDDIEFGGTGELSELMVAAWATVPWDEI
jgi:branched-subunit amino acid aminotransferase/4-amino-4-deoxychorismate lyase